MNETQLNAQFNALIEQRNHAQNTVVNLIGENAVLKEQIKVLESMIRPPVPTEEGAPAIA